MRSSSVRPAWDEVELPRSDRGGPGELRQRRSPAGRLGGGRRRRPGRARRRLDDRRPVGHEGAGAAAADEPAFVFERAIGTGDGVRREVEFLGARPHRWEPVAGKQRAAFDLALDAVAQLFVAAGRCRRGSAPAGAPTLHEKPSRRVSHAPALWFADADPDRARRADARRRRAPFAARARRGGVLAGAARDRGELRALPMRALERDAAVRQAGALRLFRGGAARWLEPGPFLWDVPDPAGPPAIALKPNGPIRVTGDVEMTYGEAPLGGRDRWSVCRCGASRCQPVCDSSHKVIGFRT